MKPRQPSRQRIRTADVGRGVDGLAGRLSPRRSPAWSPARRDGDGEPVAGTADAAGEPLHHDAAAGQALAFSFNDRDLALSPDGTRWCSPPGMTRSWCCARWINWSPAGPRHRQCARAVSSRPMASWIGVFDLLDEGVTTGPVVAAQPLRKVSPRGGPPMSSRACRRVSRRQLGRRTIRSCLRPATAPPGSCGWAGGGEPEVLTRPDTRE